MRTPRLSPLLGAGEDAGAEHSDRQAGRREGRGGLPGSPPHPAQASHHTTMESLQWFHMTHASLTVQDVSQFGFALFYVIYIFFGILYIAVGVKIVF